MKLVFVKEGVQIRSEVVLPFVGTREIVETVPYQEFPIKDISLKINEVKPLVENGKLVGLEFDVVVPKYLRARKPTKPEASYHLLGKATTSKGKTYEIYYTKEGSYYYKLRNQFIHLINQSRYKQILERLSNKLPQTYMKLANQLVNEGVMASPSTLWGVILVGIAEGRLHYIEREGKSMLAEKRGE